MSTLGQALAQAGKAAEATQVWQEAERVIHTIEDGWSRDGALRELGQALAQARAWREAERVIWMIWNEGEQVEALRELGQALAQADNYEELLRLIQQFWQAAKTRDEAFQRFGLATWLIPQYPEISMALYTGFAWVDNFLKG